MSGQPELSTQPPAEHATVEERAEALDNLLAEYEERLGVGAVFHPEGEAESKRLVGMPPSQLHKMTAEECGEAAYTLRQFAYHLQKAANRELARVNWANESIRRVIATIVAHTRGASAEERRALAIREDDVATKYDVIRVLAQTRIDRLSFLGIRVSEMARSLEALQQTKRSNFRG